MQANFYHTAMLAATMSQIAPAVIGTIFVFFGLLLAKIVMASRAEISSAQAWPSVKGRIISSRIESRRRPKQHTQYFAVIEYRYRVADKDHVNNRISFGGTICSSSQSVAEQRRQNEYPDGKEVTVYYNPANPDQSVIDRTPTKWWMGLIIALIFVGAGIGIAIQSLK